MIYVMTYKRLYASFQKFIDQDEYFTETQQHHILESFQNKRNKNIFRLSIILLIWSILGVAIDSLIIGGSLISALIQGVSWRYILPTLIFSALNFTMKSLFVSWYMKKEIPMKQILLAGIPYAGSASIIAHLVKTDSLYGLGLQHYIKYLRHRGIRWIITLMYSKK